MIRTVSAQSSGDISLILGVLKPLKNKVKKNNNNKRGVGEVVGGNSGFGFWISVIAFMI